MDHVTKLRIKRIERSLEQLLALRNLKPDGKDTLTDKERRAQTQCFQNNHGTKIQG